MGSSKKPTHRTEMASSKEKRGDELEENMGRPKIDGEQLWKKSLIQESILTADTNSVAQTSDNTRSGHSRSLPDGTNGPRILVSEPGVPFRIGSVTYSFLRDMVLPKRFPERPCVGEEEKQWEHREKWLSRCTLSTPHAASTEEQWEDWFDNVGVQVTRHGLSPAMFIFLCVRVMKPSDGAVLEFVAGKQTSYEQAIANFLRRKFVTSTYAKEVEVTLHVVPRQPTVAKAQEWLSARVARYIRACERMGRRVLLSKEVIDEAAVAILPFAVQRAFDLMLDVGPAAGWLAFWKRAELLEAKLATYGLSEERAYPVEDFDVEADDDSSGSDIPAAPVRVRPVAAAPAQAQPPRQPPTPCGLCGGDHWMRECPHKGARCERCHRLGHIEQGCRATVLKTPDGRVDVYVLPRPGSIEFRQYRDRTQQDRLRSATNVLEEVLSSTKQRAAKDKKKRQEKKAQGQLQAGQKRRRAHQVMLSNQAIDAAVWENVGSVSWAQEEDAGGGPPN